MTQGQVYFRRIFISNRLTHAESLTNQGHLSSALCQVDWALAEMETLKRELEESLALHGERDAS